MKLKSDEELVRSVQSGDISAYEQLVKRYQKGLYFFVMRILHDEYTASDIVQDALVKIYQVIDSIDTSRKFSTFLFEIAKNASFSRIRKNKRIVSLDDISEVEDDISFIETYMREDVFERLRKSVSHLPEKYSSVISLYYFEDFSYEEISTKLKIPINTVRTHIKRAKDALKKELSI